MCVGGMGWSKGWHSGKETHAGRDSEPDQKGARGEEKEEVGLREMRKTWERGSHAHGRRCKVKGWAIRAAWNGLVS